MPPRRSRTWREARAQDLPSYQAEVKRLLAQSVRNADIFFNGSRYSLVADGSANAVCATLAQPQLVPTIYSYFGDLPHRIANEEAAVKAALAGNTGNPDLQHLGVYKADGTINDGHPLITALRGRLPLADKEIPPVQAEDLRQFIEAPPYGWDGNAAKVGLALLLRMSACRLIENGNYITDPAKPEAARVLTKEQAFRSLRVQAMQVGGGMEELKAVRDHLVALFDINKPPVIAATLHTEIGNALTALAARAKAVSDWMTTAQCPVPPAFAAGQDTAQNIANLAAPAQRLPLFLSQVDALSRYIGLLTTLENFRTTHGDTYRTYRDFYTSMVNANLDIPALRDFIRDWRTVTANATVTDPARWREIETAFHAAQRALTEKAAAWREQTERELTEAEATLPDKLRAACVPEDQLAAEQEQLAARFANVRYRLQAPPTDAIAARNALIAMQSVAAELGPALHELKARYCPAAGPNETRIAWSTLLTVTRIAGDDDLARLLSSLRAAIAPALAEHKTVVLE
jgi:hypothetical protein